MGKLNLNFEPNVMRVFDFFEQISEIPRGSGNTEKIADYLVAFAKTRRLVYFRDKYDNVIIKKGATEGYENRPTVIIQGHTDIVADKIKGSVKDMEKEGVDIYLDGDFIRARETTLGGDDGIAVAYALALLDASDIPHPEIEAVFTSDEETGLIGASNIDPSLISGRIMINIDSDEEGIFTVGCAGGLRMDLKFENLKRENADGGYSLSISGFTGGHSGVEINNGHLNAIKCIGKLLSKLSDVSISSITGGNADNAIARDAVAEFSSSTDLEKLSRLASEYEAELLKSEAGARVSVTKTGKISVFSRECSQKILSALENLPSGVIAMEKAMPNMVETSMNVGIIRSFENSLEVSASLRSSKRLAKSNLKSRVREIGEKFGASVSERGEYPEWEYKENSNLRNLMKDVYTELYGKEPEIITIHAGLECGIFSDKLSGLDCVSIGPNGYDIHTPEERLSVSSTVRVWGFILEILKRI
jgi:dipeptidase D